jgi:hypothetical protein
VAWSPQALRDCGDFTGRLAPHLGRLAALGVQYYRPTAYRPRGAVQAHTRTGATGGTARGSVSYGAGAGRCVARRPGGRLRQDRADCGGCETGGDVQLRRLVVCASMPVAGVRPRYDGAVRPRFGRYFNGSRQAGNVPQTSTRESATGVHAH